jgi:hypothetical protein
MIEKETSLTSALAAGNPNGLLPDLRLVTGEQGRAYGNGMFKSEVTLTPPIAGNSTNPQMEWGRWRDVQNVYGLKRGLLHLLVIEGKIKSVLIRRRGNVHGTRYYLMSSVNVYLNSLLEDQNGGSL